MGSTASTTYQDYIEGKLITGIATGTTTGVTVKIKQVNGTTPTWPTAAHRIKMVQRTATVTKVEKIDVAAGTSQSGQTVTLGTLTRALPLSDGTDFTGSGTAQSFAAGADVFLTWDAHDAAQTVKKDLVNTLTGSGAIRSSSTSTAVVRLNSVTTAQRNAMTPGNGDMVYDSDLAQNFQYIGGSWNAVENASAQTTVKVSSNDTTPNYLASKLVAGGAISLTENSDGGNETLTVAALNEGEFGDGSDGDVTIAGDTTLTRDMYYDDLVVNSTLNTANFRIFAKTISGTGGTIRCNGNNGGNGGAGGAGAAEVGGTAGTAGTAGAALSAGYFPAPSAGQAGGAGGAGGNRNSAGSNGSNGTAGSNVSATIGTNGVAGAAGGQGGTDSGTAGGTAGTAGGAGTATALVGHVRQKIAAIQGIVFVAGTATQPKGCAGSGSGSGGGGGGARNAATAAGGGGGGGGGSGSNGGTVCITVKTLSGNVNIQAIGGNGGNGGNGGSTTTGAGGGGGGGGAPGNGGIVLLNYRDKSGWTGAISVAAGTPGTGGTAGTLAGDVSFSANGSNAAAGSSGFSQQLQI